VLSEFVVPQFVVFFFGLGALLNAVLTLIVPGLANRLPLQLLVWAATSGISLGLLRRYGAPWFRGETRHPGDDASDGAGSTAEVVESITPERPGRIRFRGTTWQARTFDETIPAGATVTILQKESLTYIVTAGDLLGENSTGDERVPREGVFSEDDPSPRDTPSRPDHLKEDS
jgi:membrane protein implicated in regulation of membrane protease activity